MKDIEWLLNEMDKRAGPGEGYYERALFYLLSAYRDKLPPLDDYFHKAFRQTDVTGSGKIDMAIWCLLHQSTLFWQLYADASTPGGAHVEEFPTQSQQGGLGRCTGR